MKIDHDHVIFNTGKERYANGGIIGINDRLEIYGGYDSSFYIDSADDKSWRDEEDILSPSELIELADHMIGMWSAFKTKVINEEKSRNE